MSQTLDLGGITRTINIMVGATIAGAVFSTLGIAQGIAAADGSIVDSAVGLRDALQKAH
ncbi:MAG: hypothetical protein ABJE99_12535 [Roseobacter sp.]